MQLNQKEYLNLLIMVCGALGTTGELDKAFSLEQLEEFEKIVEDYMGNTTINEMKSIAEGALNKLFTLATITDNARELWRDEQ